MVYDCLWRTTIFGLSLVSGLTYTYAENLDKEVVGGVRNFYLHFSSFGPSHLNAECDKVYTCLSPHWGGDCGHSVVELGKCYPDTGTYPYVNHIQEGLPFVKVKLKYYTRLGSFGPDYGTVCALYG